MKKDFNLDKMDKRMPYTTPDGFFEEFEDSVFRRLESDGEVRHMLHPGYRLKRLAWGVAAAVAVLLMLYFGQPTRHKAVSFIDVDLAFAQLSADDQSYLLNIYQEDVFLNE